MNKSSNIKTIIATGFAIFSMFFGAGNVIYPLALGQETLSQNGFAITGMLITAVGVPFIGLLAMTLFNGNYSHFFERIGKVPGFIVTALIISLMGPFGAMPRLLTVSYATFSMYWDVMSLPVFCILSTLIIFAFTFRKSKIIDVLGYVLTPVLLVSLLVVIIKGVFFGSSSPESHLTSSDAFFKGALKGYQTMDILAGLFFSSIVLACLEGVDQHEESHKNQRNTIFMTLKAGVVGLSLLALTYIGFSYVASYNSEFIANVTTDRILGTLALELLGPYGGIIAITAVALACLTTAIALAAVFSEFLHYDIFRKKVGYLPSLVITLVLNCVIAIQGFESIAAFLTPILIVLYPSLIVLSLLNIGHKLFHWETVKVPVIVTFALSVLAQFIL